MKFGPGLAVDHTSDQNKLKRIVKMNRSFVIPVLDFSPHSIYNIETLLNDLENDDGEVICIFNSREVFQKLQNHPRIDKFCYNKLNAGVSRSWNLGINLSEAESVFILNSDLHLGQTAVSQMEQYLFSLPGAVIVGPQGSHLDFAKLKVIRYFSKGTFSQPVRTHDVSGFFFCIHRQRFLEHGLCFDVRYSPCFMEEWDMGMQILAAGLACYAVPVTDFDHHWGISGHRQNTAIKYFGRTVYRDQVIVDNRRKFIAKWFPRQIEQKGFSSGDSAKEQGSCVSCF